MKTLFARARISGFKLSEILVLFLFTICHDAAAQGVTFTTNTFTVGYAPIAVVAADVNGDGKLDLISANYGLANGSLGTGNTLTVLTNNGNGGFGFNATITLNGAAGNVLAADVNGDGKVDLIRADNHTNTLTVLTNDGSGGFNLNATLTVGTNPVFVAAADVNGDGKVDLISANYGIYSVAGNNTLTVLTNNGNGVFGSNATLTVGENPQCVVAADVNGDGKVDLISADFSAGTLTVLTNNGSGVFGFSATLPVGSNPRRVIAADVNCDGKVDLISANFDSAGTLTVLTNNGSGVFGINATLNVGSLPTCVVAADINGDGQLDLISVNDTLPGTLTVLTNDGSGVFGFNTAINRDDVQYSVIAADVNGDGKLDLITANFVASSGVDTTLTVLINTSTFPPPTFTPKLTLNHQDNRMRVSWPSVSPGWSLQENPDLTQPKWLPSGYGGYSIADDGTNKSLTLPYPTGNCFFRLLHP
jgi:hypothetical protein